MLCDIVKRLKYCAGDLLARCPTTFSPFKALAMSISAAPDTPPTGLNIATKGSNHEHFRHDKQRRNVVGRPAAECIENIRHINCLAMIPRNVGRPI